MTNHQTPAESVQPQGAPEPRPPENEAASPAQPPQAQVPPQGQAPRAAADPEPAPAESVRRESESGEPPSGDPTAVAEGRETEASQDVPADASRDRDVGAPGPVRGRWRAARGVVVVAFLCGALGFALAAQLRNNETDDARFANLRQSDLVRILDELDAREKRLRGEISDLEFRHQTITSKAQGSEAALADAQRRASELGILAGTLPAEGPGLVITLTERDKPLAAERVLDAVQELRGAGAEAMSIAGASGDAVRIGASSYFVDAEGGIEVDGKQLAAPYTLIAVGDPPTVDRALKIPGGVVATVRQDGCEIRLEQRRTVQVTAVRSPPAPRFARPAS